MKRIILMLFRNLLLLPAMAFNLYRYAAHPERYSEEERYSFLRKIVHRANKTGNLNVIIRGQENIPEENGFIFYPNHQGMYDVLAIMEDCPRPFSVVSKKEVGDVPVLNKVFNVMQAILIDREDLRQSMQVIIQVSKEVKEGRNYLIFAEGTRSKKGNQTGEFKGGSFKAATKAKCPIVPVALIDCFLPFDSGTTKQLDVQVHFLKPMLYEEYKDMKTTEIAAEVKRRIEAKIAECVK